MNFMEEVSYQTARLLRQARGGECGPIDDEALKLHREVMSRTKARLVIPDGERRSPVHGEHFAYHGRAGQVLCQAGNGGAWMRFDGQGPHEYVGVPIKWLEPA